MLATVKPGDVVAISVRYWHSQLFAAGRRPRASTRWNARRCSPDQEARQAQRFRRSHLSSGDIDQINLPPVSVIVSNGSARSASTRHTGAARARARSLAETWRGMLPAANPAWIADLERRARHGDDLQATRPYGGSDPGHRSGAGRSDSAWHDAGRSAGCGAAGVWTTDTTSVSADEASSPFSAHVTVTAGDRAASANHVVHRRLRPRDHADQRADGAGDPLGRVSVSLQQPVDLSGTRIGVEFSCCAGRPRAIRPTTRSVRIADRPGASRPRAAARRAGAPAVAWPPWSARFAAPLLGSRVRLDVPDNRRQRERGDGRRHMSPAPDRESVRRLQLCSGVRWRAALRLAFSRSG